MSEFGRRRLSESVSYCLRAFVASRAALIALGTLVIGIVPPHRAVSVPGWPAPTFPPVVGWHGMFTAWERFDALWFLRIADSGYRAGDGSAAFFPGFPMVVRAVSWAIGGHPLAAGLIVANVAFLGALIAVHALTAEERGGGTARAVVVLLCWFPTSLFFLMPYSESLFLAAVAIAFLAARRQRWAVACSAALVAGLTRNFGILLVPAFLAEAIAAWRRGGLRSTGGPIAAGTSAAAGFGAYLLWWGSKGDLMAPFSAQANWQREFSLPWVTLWNGVRIATSRFGTTDGGYWMFDLVIVSVMIAGAIWATRRLRPGPAVYMWGGLLLPLTFAFPGRPLMSMPRLVLPLFPALWGLVDLSHRLRMPAWALPAISAALLGIVTLIVVNGYYIF